MLRFIVGAQLPTTDKARRVSLNGARDLVHRTLAAHGLMPAPFDERSGQPQQVMPSAKVSLGRCEVPFAKGFSRPVSVPAGAKFRQEQFSCAAGSRAYRTYVPASAIEGVTGIVVMLHGCTQNPEDFAAGTGMNALSETHRFIVVYPLQSRGDNAQSCWNWFSRGDQHRDRGEPAILAGMTRKVMAEFGLSGDQTFVAGLSAGAAMAVILGETYPDVFSAVGAHSGLPFGAAKDLQSAHAAMGGAAQSLHAGSSDTWPARTIVFHGKADKTVHPSNGERIAKAVINRSGGRNTHTKEEVGHLGRNYSRTVTVTAEGVTALEHWVVEGLGHAWSGGQAGGSYTDPHGPDASAEMVRFFFDAYDGSIKGNM